MRGNPVYLRGRGGVIRGVVLVDPEDEAKLADRRWYLGTIGYAVDRCGTYLHRVVLGLERGDGLVVDHINGDKLDNRKENLRVGTQALNVQNRTRCCGTSKYRGVAWDKSRNRWTAYGKINGKAHHLGRFKDEEKAAAAAAAFRAEHMPWSSEAAA